FPTPLYLYTLSLHDALPIFVPEVIEDFFCLAGPVVGVAPKEVKDDSHVYRIGKVPRPLWPLGEQLEPDFGRLAREYKHVAFDKEDRKSTRLNSSHLGISYAV